MLVGPGFAAAEHNFACAAVMPSLTYAHPVEEQALHNELACIDAFHCSRDVQGAAVKMQVVCTFVYRRWRIHRF